MRLLLDTCTFAWACAAPHELSDRARDVIADRSNEVFVSSLSIWEIHLKRSLGQFVLKGKAPREEPALTVSSMREQMGFQPLPFREECAEHLALLPELHKDPFDRALIATAVFEELLIVTPDSLIRQYAIKTVW